MIVYQAPWNWATLENRSQPLARALAKHTDVVYLDLTPPSVWDSPGQKSGLHRLDAHLWLFTWPRRLIRSRNIAVHFDRSENDYKTLGNALSSICPPDGRLVLLNSRPAAERLRTFYAWHRILVDVEDPWWDLAWGSKVVASGALERTLRHADFIFANGTKLLPRIRSITDRPAESLPNAIDVAFGERIASQPRMVHPRRLCAGFIGTINDRLDPDFLVELVDTFPDIDFRFVGPVILAGAKRRSWKALFGRNNFQYLAPVSHDDVPEILAAIDILLLPYFNAGGRDMNPAKALEYRCTGKPVVSTIDISADYGEGALETKCESRVEFIAAFKAIGRSSIPQQPAALEILWTWERAATRVLEEVLR